MTNQPAPTSAPTDFEFRIGQKVRGKHSGGMLGFVIERRLVWASAGVRREYLVRHSPDKAETYLPFELEEIP